MIGLIRFAMALVVMISHTVPGWWPAASWAVFGFYALSGYLITLLCSGRYKGRFIAFWMGRFLRVYPAYLCVMIITLAVLWLWDCNNPVLCSYMGHPDLGQWFLIVRNGTARTVPQAWAITIELFWWCAISLGIAATRRRSLLWLAASIPIFAVAYPTGPLWFSPLGGALPFALGSVAYCQGLKLPKDKGVFVVLGGLSYPVFLIHFLVAALIPMPLGWPLFFASLPPTLALSWLLVVAVERPIARYRKTLQAHKET